MYIVLIELGSELCPKTASFFENILPSGEARMTKKVLFSSLESPVLNDFL